MPELINPNNQSINWKQLYIENKSDCCFEFAEFLKNKYKIKTIGCDKRQMFGYNDQGVYFRCDNTIKKEIGEALRGLATKHVVDQIIEHIKMHSPAERAEIDCNLINLRNGVLNITTETLRPHDPDLFFHSQLNCSFDKNSACPNFIKFLKETIQPEDVDTIQEWMGFNLYRSYFIKKAVIMVGEKNTGKTTFIRILYNWLGSENIQSISLHKLSGGNSFTTVGLYNKMANIYDDLSKQDITDNGAFKIATGNSPMSAEYKFGEQFSFTNYAKMTFACNDLPGIKNINDDAYFSRWIVIKFLNKPKVMDNFLAEKIYRNETEKSGILNWALIGLKRILAKGEFSYRRTSEEIKEEMMCGVSSVAVFVYKKLEIREYGVITKKEMHEIYNNYCLSLNLAAEPKRTFGHKFKSLCGWAYEGWGGKDGKEEVWRNVAVKQEQTETMTDDQIAELAKENEQIPLIQVKNI